MTPNIRLKFTDRSRWATLLRAAMMAGSRLIPRCDRTDSPVSRFNAASLTSWALARLTMTVPKPNVAKTCLTAVLNVEYRAR